jgi:CheY-like chemotaxis protein/Flp pilus assembly protein TadD
MRLEIDTTVSVPPVADSAERRAAVDSAEAKSTLTQGIKAAQAGDRVQARIALTKATKLDPRSESAWLWLASISEYPEELLGFLNQVLDINPENERAIEWKKATHALLSKTFVQRGIDAMEENKAEFAFECFQTALDYNDQNAAAWLWMASVSDSNPVKISMLERAVALEPGNQAAASALENAREGVVKQKLAQAKAAAVAGNNREAISLLDALLCVSPEMIDAWMLKSHLSDSFDEKIRCFESILRIDPSNVAARASRDSLLTILEAVEEPPVQAAEVSTSVSPDEIPAMRSESSMDMPAVPTAQDTPTVGPVSFVVEPAPEYRYTPEIVSSPIQPEISYARENDEVAETNYEKEEPENISEPFASFAEETSRSVEEAVYTGDFQPDAPHSAEYVDDYRSDSPADETEYQESAYADPAAETVAFSYDPSSALSDDYSAEPTAAEESGPFELDPWSTEPTSEGAIAKPSDALPDLEPASSTRSSYETFVESRDVEPAAQRIEEHPMVRPEWIHCPFCGQTNDAQAIACVSCTAVLTLSDLELLLSNHDSNKPVLRQAVDNMERERSTRKFSPEELVTLGLGHLNLRNLQFGYDCLMEASKLSPNNVVLTGQVNSLLIRLDEIRRQEEAHLKMPKGKSILVVDDSPTVLKLIAGKLEKSGHEVVCANDGVEAIERLENYVPDLVLLDITMPRMDGYQVCKQIRSNPATKDVTVVMISGKDGFFDKVRGRMAGATGYITKPFGPETLMKTVEMYLSGEVPELDEV